MKRLTARDRPARQQQQYLPGVATQYRRAEPFRRLSGGPDRHLFGRLGMGGDGRRVDSRCACPEPSSVVALVGLCGMGLIGLIRYRRRSASRNAL